MIPHEDIVFFAGIIAFVLELWVALVVACCLSWVAGMIVIRSFQSLWLYVDRWGR